MRNFWSIERAVLEEAAHEYPTSADALREQMVAAQVASFENTGGGFFSTVRVSRAAPRLTDKSPLDAATGSVGSIEPGMGFLVFVEDGYVSLIEGYAQGDASTANVDFESVTFDMKPWSVAGK